jgi:hypothetical protein
MTITYLDLILILLAIGIASTTGIHWAFAIAVSIFVSAVIKALIRRW